MVPPLICSRAGARLTGVEKRLTTHIHLRAHAIVSSFVSNALPGEITVFRLVWDQYCGDGWERWRSEGRRIARGSPLPDTR